MTDIAAFQALSPTTLADALRRENVMDIGIRPLWDGMPRVAGPAWTVKCAPGDNLMLHAAIHVAEPGSVIVVEAGDVDYAVAGGNVCAVAQKRGIVAFVIDGVIRDLAEIRANRFPVFARGISPIPGKKEVGNIPRADIRCGGVLVSFGDIVVADEEGIVVVPQAEEEEILAKAQARAARDASETLEEWQLAHRAKIKAMLDAQGIGML